MIPTLTLYLTPGEDSHEPWPVILDAVEVTDLTVPIIYGRPDAEVLVGFQLEFEEQTVNILAREALSLPVEELVGKYPVFSGADGFFVLDSPVASAVYSDKPEDAIAVLIEAEATYRKVLSEREG